MKRNILDVRSNHQKKKVFDIKIDAKQPNMEHVRSILNKAQIWSHSFKKWWNSFFSLNLREIH